jgi:eukaryotic-like serine/threonine-protein kinase
MEKLVNDRFAVLKKLGEGGFGDVFLVHDNLVKTICALKVIRRELSSNKNMHDRFIQEAKIWMEFEKHPNIVNVAAEVSALPA